MSNKHDSLTEILEDVEGYVDALSQYDIDDELFELMRQVVNESVLGIYDPLIVEAEGGEAAHGSGQTLGVADATIEAIILLLQIIPGPGPYGALIAVDFAGAWYYHHLANRVGEGFWHHAYNVFAFICVVSAAMRLSLTSQYMLIFKTAILWVLPGTKLNTAYKTFWRLCERNADAIRAGTIEADDAFDALRAATEGDLELQALLRFYETLGPDALKLERVMAGAADDIFGRLNKWNAQEGPEMLANEAAKARLRAELTRVRREDPSWVEGVGPNSQLERSLSAVEVKFREELPGLEAVRAEARASAEAAHEILIRPKTAFFGGALSDIASAAMLRTWGIIRGTAKSLYIRTAAASRNARMSGINKLEGLAPGTSAGMRRHVAVSGGHRTGLVGTEATITSVTMGGREGAGVISVAGFEAAPIRSILPDGTKVEILDILPNLMAEVRVTRWPGNVGRLFSSVRGRILPSTWTSTQHAAEVHVPVMQFLKKHGLVHGEHFRLRRSQDSALWELDIFWSKIDDLNPLKQSYDVFRSGTWEIPLPLLQNFQAGSVRVATTWDNWIAGAAGGDASALRLTSQEKSALLAQAHPLAQLPGQVGVAAGSGPAAGPGVWASSAPGASGLFTKIRLGALIGSMIWGPYKSWASQIVTGALPDLDPEDMGSDDGGPSGAAPWVRSGEEEEESGADTDAPEVSGAAPWIE